MEEGKGDIIKEIRYFWEDEMDEIDRMLQMIHDSY